MVFLALFSVGFPFSRKDILVHNNFGRHFLHLSTNVVRLTAPYCCCQYSGTPFDRPTSLKRPMSNVTLNINVQISTPEDRPPLLKGLISFTDKGLP